MPTFYIWIKKNTESFLDGEPTRILPSYKADRIFSELWEVKLRDKLKIYQDINDWIKLRRKFQDSTSKDDWIIETFLDAVQVLGLVF